MTRYSKKNGKYLVSGSKYDMLIGTRAQVWHGTAYKTSGGLKKTDLLKNKAGRIVSKSKYTSAKREKRLVKNGYGSKKGHFGFVKLNGTSKHRKMKGGKAMGSSYSPANTNGQVLTQYSANGPSSIDVQLAAGQSGGKRRKKGGKGYGWMNQNNGQPLTQYSQNGPSSIDVQLAAGQSGGKGYGWMNQNDQPLSQYSANGPSSIDVQLAAGQSGGKKKKMK